MKTYLNLMIDSLEKKLAVLEQIQAASEKQAGLIKAEPFDQEQFDKAMDEKAEQIEQLNQLDDGFDSLYSRIREELPAHKEAYREQIGKLQELIRQITEKSAAVQVVEQRNRAALEKVCARENERLRAIQNKSLLMKNYARNMSQVNYIDPQFMDWKK